MSTREELVQAVELSRGIFDVAWDAYMDAACDIRSVFWAQAYAAWDVLNDAYAALKAYDKENT